MQITLKKVWEEVWDIIKFLAPVIIIVFVVRTYVAQPFIVDGESMSPNFHTGHYLIIDEFSYHFREPKRGEVIVLRYPLDPKRFFLKRIVGMPGDRIYIKSECITTINEGVCVHCFFICLTKEVLATFWIRHMLVNRKDDIVGRQRFSRREESHVPHNQSSFVIRKTLGIFPGFKVLLHVHLFRCPVIIYAIFVMRTRPVIFNRQDLIRIRGACVKDKFFSHDNSDVNFLNKDY